MAGAMLVTGGAGGRAPGAVRQPSRLPSHQVPAMPKATT
jgi:hypothetical protein